MFSCVHARTPRSEDDRCLKLGLLSHFCHVLNKIIISRAFLSFLAEFLYHCQACQLFSMLKHLMMYLPFAVEGDLSVSDSIYEIMDFF